LTFEKTCSLDIKLYGSRIDKNPDKITAYHIGGDGTEDQMGILKLDYDPLTESLQLLVAVDGFSRYGLRTSK